jgi:hypothetical protein
MNRRTPEEARRIAESLGSAEKLVQLIINFRDHSFMLAQSRAAEPITEEQNGKKVVLFHDDDYRDIGEAMVKLYERGSNRMMNPKLIQRVGEVPSLPGVVTMNRISWRKQPSTSELLRDSPSGGGSPWRRALRHTLLHPAIPEPDDSGAVGDPRLVVSGLNNAHASCG